MVLLGICIIIDGQDSLNRSDIAQDRPVSTQGRLDITSDRVDIKDVHVAIRPIYSDSALIHNGLGSRESTKPPEMECSLITHAI